MPDDVFEHLLIQVSLFALALTTGVLGFLLIA